MPFRTLPRPAPTADTAERYLPDLPEPLVVAVLDKDEERDGLTTAVLVYGFSYTHPASGAEVAVPAGFVTDFASIPELARSIIEAFGRHAKAAVLHDWLYAVGEPGKKWFADQIFYDAMAELGVDMWRRKIMYQAVHVGGGNGYDNAANDWPTSWADWRTGDPITTGLPARESSYQAKWLNPPRADYKPW